jgi:GDP-mannose 6-dehydrogenase
MPPGNPIGTIAPLRFAKKELLLAAARRFDRRRAAGDDRAPPATIRLTGERQHGGQLLQRDWADLQASGVEDRKVMAMLCTDRKLNISPTYLRLGFAFAGSCLFTDLRALRYHSESHNVPSHVLDIAMAAIQQQVDRVIGLITRGGRRCVEMLGLAFKSDSDALRHFPHLFDLLVADFDAPAQNNIVVIGTPQAALHALAGLLRADEEVVDLAGHNVTLRKRPAYAGIGW